MDCVCGLETWARLVDLVCLEDRRRALAWGLATRAVKNLLWSYALEWSNCGIQEAEEVD